MKLRILLIVMMAIAQANCANTTAPGAVGIKREQLLLVSAADVEQMAAIHYAEQNAAAKKQGKLISSGEEYSRLERIMHRLIKQVGVFRQDAINWKWQLSLIDDPTLNASCAPGGKITFYTGMVRQLKLTDDEIAAIMGHEIAHALREHGREKVSEASLQQMIGNIALATTQNMEKQIALADQVANIALVLPNSRQKESEADRMGLELMARAGYNPHAAVDVWKKMTAASKGSPPEFLSTHPAHATRINELESLLPVVQPLYDVAPRS